MAVDVDHGQAALRGGTAEVPAVRMEAVYKHYGDFAALTEIDLRVARGEKIVICGPSTCRKSMTLIRCINHIESTTPD